MLRKNQTKLIVIAALSLAIVSLSLVTMKMLTYEKPLTSKTGEKLALDDNAAALKKSSDFYRGIVLPGWRELTVSVDESCQATGIDFYNPADNLFYRCPRCLNVVAEKRCDKCEENYEKKELVEDCFYLRFSLILDDNDELIYQSVWWLQICICSQLILQEFLNLATTAQEYSLSPTEKIWLHP